MLTVAAGSAYHAHELADSIRYSTKILELAESAPVERFLPDAHFYLGNALDDAGQAYAGIAHLEIARRLRQDESIYHNDAGVAYRHVGDLPRALACFEQGLALSPDHSQLLVNRVAAAIEAGDAARAREALGDLSRHLPDDPSLEGLARILNKWLADSGEPPRLLRRIPERPPSASVQCTGCNCQVPVPDKGGVLCAGCGAELSDEVGVCPYCQSDGIVPLVLVQAGMSVMCPYCRNGRLQLHDLDERL